MLVILVIAVCGAVAGGVSVAGAQTTTTTVPFTCSYTLSTTTLGIGGGPVQISGTAPADTTVRILVNNVEVATALSNNVTGAWGPVTLTITTTSTIAVSIAANYPATPCIGPASVSVQTAAAALPRTGSNDTMPLVLIGAVVLLVGTVLVLATRRRERTRGRV